MNSGVSRRALLAGALLGSAAIRAVAGAHAPAGGMRRLIANENPYGPSPAARAAAARGVADAWKYAQREVQTLRREIAEYEQVEPAQVMVCAGSTEALRVAALALARGGGQVITARPTFAFFPDYARAVGCEVVEIPLNDGMAFDLTAMAEAVTADTRAVYVCNPNNPTGTRLSGDSLDEFIRAVAPRSPVVVDEAYLDLDPDWRRFTAVRSVRSGATALVTRTFSKLHGMAGLRIGYAIGPTDLIERLENLRISQLNYPGVLAASASLADAEFVAFSRERIREAMQITTAALEAVGRPYQPSFGNFVFFDTGGPAREFMGAMRGRGILTGMPSAAYPEWARISMGTTEDMQAVAAALRELYGVPA